eukprot:10714328-Ditylum_brightwellii.AAC.1
MEAHRITPTGTLVINMIDEVSLQCQYQKSTVSIVTKTLWHALITPTLIFLLILNLSRRTLRTLK